MVLDEMEAILKANFEKSDKAHLVRYADDVRHMTRRLDPSLDRGKVRKKMTFESTTYLNAKARGDSSMLIKRKTPEDAYGAVLQDPCDMVRAKLPKPQSPGMEAYIPRLQRLMAGLS